MRRRLAVLGAVLVLLDGCGVPAGPVGPGASSTGPGHQSASGNPSSGAGNPLPERADCPASDPTVAARPDGLPDLTLECLGGGRAVRLAGLRGRPLVINLWAQWCAPCREESPHLREFAARAAGKVEMLGIDYNDPEPALAAEFAGLVGWRYPQLVDPKRTIEGRLRVPGIPMTLLVASDGRIVHRITGPIPSADALIGLVADKLGVTL